MRIIIAVMLLCASLCAIAFDPPDGFRGHKWGESLDKFKGAKLVEDAKSVKFYVLPKDKLQIGDAKLTKITYGFYENQFFSVQIEFGDYDNYSNIKSTLDQTYGPAYRPNQFMEKYIWGLSSDVLLWLEFREILKKGSLAYLYKPLNDKYQAVQDEAAKKAASDL